MTKEILKDLIDQNLSTRQIGVIISRSPTTVSNLLKKFGMSTNHVYCNIKQTVTDGYKSCSICKEIKHINDFVPYKRKDKILRLFCCKRCKLNENILRRRAFKQQCLDHKGGACIVCGYNKCVAALDFHHINPCGKDFNITGGISYNILSDKIKKELDKCVLLCSNCHREEHFLHGKGECD